MAQKPNFHIFDFFSETPSKWRASYYASRLSRPRPLQFVKIIVKLHLLAFWQIFENEKMQKFGFLKKSSPKLLDKILRYCTQKSSWVCVIKVCSNGGDNYIIGEIIAKDNLNIAN